MYKNTQRKKIFLAVTVACLVLLFCSCVKEIPNDGTPAVEGRETLFAPVTTSPDEITETTVPPSITTSPLAPETTSPQEETTASKTETVAPETTENVETENPVFTGGFSGLY